MGDPDLTRAATYSFDSVEIDDTGIIVTMRIPGDVEPTTLYERCRQMPMRFAVPDIPDDWRVDSARLDAIRNAYDYGVP